MYKEKTIIVYVKAIEQETEFVKRFTLATVDGKPLPKFSGGAHISTFIEEEKVIVRQYSLTSNPDETQDYQIAVRLSETSRGGSWYWHQKMKIGDKLFISYPKNQFPLSFKAKHHVFYAAGIGITPFLSMIKDLTNKGAPFELHYASKSREACAFYEYLQRYFPNQCHYYFSNKKQRMNVSFLERHPIGTHVYFCGPETFITQFTDEAVKLGYPNSSIHYERFAPPQQINTMPFHVQMKNGTLIPVSKDQSLLEALLEQGINAPYSCRVGRCGTCELQVKEGEIDHHDSFLSDEQKKTNSKILACVSRAKSSKLLLEI